ncbi:diguanylate cyclase domain-containing protein [Candidatus Magnetominusculus dajiuhuensis]|uniref:sensor domain-containing diguanylate cyclase n=1 Tax=Candidatus Magnetominusculus dajiuhuensis TaxID=3137712 RepID=UPI003B42F259
MDLLEQFFKHNMDYISLIYGFAFFFMGVAISIQPKSDSKFRLSQNIWLLSVFALLHGINEWLDMMAFIHPAQTILNKVGFIFSISSFCFLLEFGRKSILTTTNVSLHKKFLYLKWWLLPLVLLVISVFIFNSANWIIDGQILSRYFIALPGSIFTAASLLLYRKEANIKEHVKLDKYFITASIIFIVYGILSGLVVPKGSIFPSTIINTGDFLSFVHVPVQAFRALAALIIAVSVIGIIKLFNYEAQGKMQTTIQELSSLERQLEQRISDLRNREVLQEALKNILEISLEDIPLKTKLERSLDIIVSIPDISIENKGCIHLKTDGVDELRMIAHRNLHDHLLSACARLKFGQCLCGLAASTGKTIFSCKIDTLHSIRFDGIHEHGHYCVPIRTGSVVLGVLCLYVKHNHERNREEETAFVSISNAIASIIDDGKKDDEIKRINKFTNTIINSINDSIMVIDIKDFTIVSTNNTFLRDYRQVESEVTGRHCYTITHKASEPCNQQEVSCPIMTMLRTGEHAVSEHVHYDTDGKEIYVSCSASPIRDEAGNIVQCVYVLKNVSQRKYYEKQLQQLAHYDVVTSLPNRILLLDRLNISIEFTVREGNTMAVLFIDLDKFKAVNDTYGHETGDALLKEVSKRLLSAVRKSDTVARVGGDEFIIILTKVMGKDDAGLIANKIIVSLNKLFFVNGHECHIGGSIGIELYPFSDIDSEIDNVPDMLIKRADMAMYRAKELGKNRYEVYSSELSGERESPLFK